MTDELLEKLEAMDFSGEWTPIRVAVMQEIMRRLIATIREHRTQRAEITRLQSQIYRLTEDAGRQGD